MQCVFAHFDLSGPKNDELPGKWKMFFSPQGVTSVTPGGNW